MDMCYGNSAYNPTVISISISKYVLQVEFNEFVNYINKQRRYGKCYRRNVYTPIVLYISISAQVLQKELYHPSVIGIGKYVSQEDNCYWNSVYNTSVILISIIRYSMLQEECK